MARQDSIESFVHHRRAANPNLLDVLEAKLADLLPDELLIPSSRVDFLLRKAQVQMEVVGFCPSAVGFQGFKELERHTLAPAREGYVEVKLECFWINHQLLFIRLFFVRVKRASKPNLSDIES